MMDKEEDSFGNIARTISWLTLSMQELDSYRSDDMLDVAMIICQLV